MKERRSALYTALLAIAFTVACHHGIPPVPNFHADVSDPSGDAVRRADGAVSPDLVHGTVDVANGTITFAITFAPGTFDRSSTRVTVQLDTDQNPATGRRTRIGLGIDDTIDMWAPTNEARVFRAVPTGACTAASPCYVSESVAELDVRTDGMAVTLPMTSLTRDGHLNFRIVAYAMAPGTVATEPTQVLDTMPDVTLPPAHVP